MDLSRRKFIQGAAAAGAAGLGLGTAGDAAQDEHRSPQRKKRTIYFNDARHYYLFVFEPPMHLQDAWRPVDECAGTSVDTFVYGVARNDGLFYPSKVGMRFGEDKKPFTSAPYYRVWHNMQSLMDRGHDPLTVLIDRAHDKSMEFFASLRMAGYGGMDPKHDSSKGGRALAVREVRDHQFRVLKELATDYDTDGVELDFAASPGGMPLFLQPEDVEEYTPVITEYVRQISDMVRTRPRRPGLVGARVYPTEEICLKMGVDVRTWLSEKLVDYVVPMLYRDFNADPDMPIDGIIRLAHDHDIPCYGMVQPYSQYEATGSPTRLHLTPETLRAVAANFYSKGVDGLYTWFFKWPLGDSERSALTEMGDPDLVKEGNKRYVKRRRRADVTALGYDADLPIEIPEANPAKRYSIPFNIADDIAGDSDRIQRVQLRLRVQNLVSADRLTIHLNGESLENEICLRSFGRLNDPYSAQFVEFDLQRVRPRQGANVLEISLDQRPELFAGGVTIENLDIYVEYGAFPPGLIT